MYNSTWLSKLTFTDVVNLASNFTVQQMLERDMFAERLKKNIPIHVHEFMYPLMQGYDSVAMDVDVEVCGTDQIFNALAGRTLMKRMKDKDKFVIALNLIANPKTGELMSKSNGTGVFIGQPANDLFGNIMSLPDPMIEPLFLQVRARPKRASLSILSKDSMAKRRPRLPSKRSKILLPKAAFRKMFRKSGLRAMRGHKAAEWARPQDKGRSPMLSSKRASFLRKLNGGVSSMVAA